MKHSHNFINLTGMRFGRLQVLSYAGRTPDGRDALFNVRCDCGEKFVARSYSLRSGATRSCGCIRREKAAALLEKITKNSIPVRIVCQEDLNISYYPSMAAAAVKLGCTPKNVRDHLHSGRPYKNHIIQKAK